MVVITRITPRLAALALLGALAAGQAPAATTVVKASAKVAKPVTLSVKRDLDFGTITLPAAPGSYTVSISMTGALSCPTGLTCSGTPRPAIFNTSGSNGQVVRIFAAQSDLINASDGSKIRFTPIAPASVTLTNSGFPGKDFNVGGSIVIPSTASDGLYSGTVEITVEYQ
jgi:spore coat protein U-like protein